MSHNLLSELQIQAVKEVIEREVAGFLHNLPEFIDRTLREATLTALGLKQNHKGLVFSDAHDNWLRKYFEESITRFVTTDTREYLNEVLRTAMQDKAIKNKIIAELHEVYSNIVISKLRQSIRARAEHDADTLIDMIGDKLKYNPNQDLNDPDSYRGPLGEIFLEQIAKNIIESEDDHGVIGFDSSDFTIDDEIPF